MFGTQSPADVLRSPIAHTILEQCATKIFLPNPHASARDYVEGFGLTRREFELVRDELTPQSHRFLVKQGADAVVASSISPDSTTRSRSCPDAWRPSPSSIACALFMATTRPPGCRTSGR